jgi:nucleoid DNA-binding protein
MKDMLIQQITERTGISDAQARQAVEMVATYIKTQLPPALGTQIDSLLDGQGNQAITDQAQQMLGNLGGMFGKQ